MLLFDRPSNDIYDIAPRSRVALWRRSSIVRLALIACLMMFTTFKHSRLEASTAVKTESEYLIKNWSVDDGLPSSSVYSIRQTRDGYLWLSTRNRLLRFDGIQFVDAFPEVPEPTLIHVRSEEGLWISDKEGRLYHRDARSSDGASLRLVTFPSGVREGPYQVFLDQAGTYWIFHNGRILRWKDGAWLPGAARLPADFKIVRQVAPDRWLGHLGGKLGIFQDGDFGPVRDAQGLEPIDVEWATPGNEAGAWLLAGTGVTGYALRTVSDEGIISAPVPVPWSPGIMLSHMHADRRGNLWIAGPTHGLLRYGRDGVWESFDRRNGLATDIVLHIFEDAESNIWVGTDGGGVHRLSRRTFRTYGIADGLAIDNVYSVAPSKTGGVWIGTHSSAAQPLFKFHNNTITFQPGMGFYGWSVHEDASGTVWLGDYENSLYSMREGKRGLVLGAPSGVYAICDDGEGGIWAGGNGLCRVRADSDQGEAMDWMPKKVISSLAREPDGTLWIGTVNGGLFRRQGDQLTQFTTTDGLPHNEVLSLYSDQGTSLWIGTRKGMSRWKAGKFVNLTLADGLLAEAVSGMAEDHRGNFWIHSPTGISRVPRNELDAFVAGTRKRLVCIGYGRDDGLVTSASTAGTQARICQDNAGRMWFTTLKGVAVADPAKMPINTNPPPIVIEQVLANGKPLVQPMVSSLLGTNARFEFGPGIQGFTIRYTANSFTAPDKVRFRYRLQGLSAEWTEAGTRREAVYDRLAHGDYRFEVTACNNHGLWNDRGAIFAFTVLPFFWETTWFQLSAVVAIMAAVGLAVRQISTRRLRRRLVLVEQDAAVERERARISRDMHDDLGARLTKISLLGELANRSLAQPGEAQEHLQKLSNLASETSETLGELIWTLKPANDSLRSLAGHLCQQTEEYLRETGIRCRFDLPETLPDTRVASDLRRQIVLSVKEALNNVVKHSGANEVRLSVQSDAGALVVEISDNGKGLSAEMLPRAGGGNGLVNLRQRLERFGGHCEIGNQATGGVRVLLTVPVEVSEMASPRPVAD